MGLRLVGVGGQDDHPAKLQDAREIVVEVRIRVDSGGGVVPLVGMDGAAEMLARQEAGAEGPQVAGKIESEPGELARIVADWLQHLREFGRSDATVKSWGRMVERDIADAGWRSVGDLAFGPVMAFLGAQRQAREWSASTMRCHLAALKSLERHARRVREGDLSAAQGPSDDDASDGARAATTDELRRQIAAALDRQAHDGRSRSNRALWLLCQALAGCRVNEPGSWLWGDLHLDEPVPFMVWRPTMQKNGRRMTLALAPELTDRLRAWRDELGRDALPAAKVFRFKPPTVTFRRDMERAGVDHLDSRGRPYSPHSARKWLRTTLVGTGCADSIADHLMRHISLRGRYTDPDLHTQRDWLSRLPRLWPDSAQALVHKGPEQIVEKIVKDKSCYSPARGDTCGAETDSPMLPTPQDITTPSTLHASMARLSNGSVQAGCLGSSCFTVGPFGHTEDQVGASAPVMSEFGAQAQARTFAKYLRATADLIESVDAGRLRKGADREHKPTA